MPQSKAPEQHQAVNLNTEPFQFDTDVLADAYALTLVNQQFQTAEAYRNTNHDQKWIIIDQLYQGVVPQRNWTNSDQPKSAIPNNISFEHTEGPIARMESELFDSPDFFQVQAEGNTDPRDARKIQKFFEACFERDERFVDGREELRLAIRNFCKYGTCFTFVEWLGDKFRGRIRNLDLKDVFTDPDCRTPFTEDARFIVIRRLITAEDLADMRDNNPKDENGEPYLKIPSDEVIAFMLNSFPGSVADTTKNVSDMVKGSMPSSGASDPVSFPDQNRIELLYYYDHKHVIWTLNRVWSLLNRKNETGFLPIESAACREHVDKLYGIGFPEAIRWQQRLTEGLWNAHIDELAIAMDPPVTGPRSSKNSDLVIRPGRYSQVDNPKDIQVHQTDGATKDVMGEITQLEIMAERRNGTSSLDSSGVARPGNINRTREGVLAQSEGGDTRLAHVVRNFDAMICRLLYKIRRLVQLYTRPGQVLLEGYKSPDGAWVADPVTSDLFHQNVSISVECAQRMLSRGRVGQMLPMLMQSLLNPGVIQELHSVNKTVDIGELVEMMLFATGSKKYFNLVRDLNQEEIKARQQPPPQVQAQMQKSQQDAQLRSDATNKRFQADMTGHQVELQKAQIAKEPSPMEMQQQQMEMQMKQQEFQQKMQLGQQQVQVAAQKADIMAQSDQRKAQTEQQKQGLEQQKMQMDALGSQQEHQLNLRQMIENHRLQMQQSQMTHMQGMQQAAQRASLPKQPKAGNK